MAWVVSAIFIHQADIDELIGRVENRLRAGSESPEQTLLGSPAPVIISPAVNDWRVITGLRPWVSELRGAANGVASCCKKTLCCELIGHALALRLTEIDPAGNTHTMESPPEYPWSNAEAFVRPMPLYEDVEQRAFTTLSGLGIPKLLILMHTKPLGRKGIETLEGGIALSLGKDGGLVQKEVNVEVPIPGVDGAPLIFRHISEDFGLGVSDDRYVEGQPTAPTVDRLLALQDALERRLKKCSATGSATLQLTYHGGAFQTELDTLLVARGHPIPPDPRPPTAPWWAFWRYLGMGWRKRR